MKAFSKRPMAARRLQWSFQESKASAGRLAALAFLAQGTDYRSVASLRPPRCVSVFPWAPPLPEEVLMSRRWASDLAVKQEVIDAVASLLLEGGYLHADDEPMLCICLDEAVANAIRHGNQQVFSKVVEVLVGVDQDRWCVAVGDEGEGFDPNNVPDPTTEHGLLAESGRGIRIMNAWLDQLIYYREGRTIVMARRRADRYSPLAGG